MLGNVGLAEILNALIHWLTKDPQRRKSKMGEFELQKIAKLEKELQELKAPVILVITENGKKKGEIKVQGYSKLRGALMQTMIEKDFLIEKIEAANKILNDSPTNIFPANADSAKSAIQVCTVITEKWLKGLRDCLSQEPKEEVFYDCQGYGPQKIVKKSSVANEPIKEAKP